MQKTVSQNIATGSHSRVSKIKIWPKSCSISLRWSFLRYLTRFFEVLVLLRPKVHIVRNILQKTVSQNIATGSHSRVSKIEIWPKSCSISLRWSLLRYLTRFYEVLVLLWPKVCIIRNILQKTVSQNIATGSHSRMPKIEILPIS